MRDLVLYTKDILLKKTPFTLALGVGLFLFFLAWSDPVLPGLAARSAVPVRVNGQSVVFRANENVASLVKRAGFRGVVGDLLDVEGEVLVPGGGWEQKVLLNGRPATSDTPVDPRARVDVLPAMDRQERIVTEVVDIVAADKIEGSGPYVIVKDVGFVGKKLTAKGRRSGKLMSARNLAGARPFHLARTDQKPEKVVALTFDDGPTPPYTLEIVRILKEMYATGTFFVIGSQASMYPDTVRAVNEAGLPLANHSYSHSRLDYAPPDGIAAELDAASNTVASLTGSRPVWFRPPYGATSPVLEQVAANHGYRTIRWTVDSMDWAGLSAPALADKILREVHPGAVVLMHDGGGNRSSTVNALPLIIKGLYEQGYSLVTLDQLTQ